MINNIHIENLNNDTINFLEAEPFNHIVLDHFIGDANFINTVAEEIKNLPNDKFDFNEHEEVQIKKRGCSQLENMPPNTRKLVEFFQSQDFINYLEKLTGISLLLVDHELYGGGIHRMETGGHLAIHADFNIHIKTHNYRRINALLYLNPEWENEWNGFLELWNKDMTIPVRKIAPILNRLVIFRITDDAFHGHPIPLNTPPHIKRHSIAFYYYTKDRPEHEKGPFHWALWQRLPNGKFSA
jgi:Rps23 Pro-64 3,4-dihydroxylase Tpa1-like proline 4-hydroxylase